MILRWQLSAIAILAVSAVAAPACSGPVPDGPHERVARATEPLQQGVGPSSNEPTLVINPINPYNIAISTGGAFSLSTDYGASFNNYSFAEPPGTGENNSGDAVLTFDSRGHLFGVHVSLLPSGLGDLIVNEINPLTGQILNTYNATSYLHTSVHDSTLHDVDKPWFVADHYANSLYKDRLYLAWGESAVWHAAYSADHGVTWHFVNVFDVPSGSGAFGTPCPNAPPGSSNASPGRISLPSEANAYGVNIGVSFNGNVYMAYNAQNCGTNTDGQPNGTSGSVVLLRSADGGQDFNWRTIPFGKGAADIPFDPGTIRTIPHNHTFTAGSAIPYVVPDTTIAQNIYVVAADDENNGGVANIHVFMVRSADFGQTFTSPYIVDKGGFGTSLFPTAAMDDRSGCLAVMWLNNASAVPSAPPNASDYKLDLVMRSSMDHGVTFSPQISISDAPLDPDLNAGTRGVAGTDFRIGEYNGLSVVNGVAYAAWTGNDPSSQNQRIQYDSASACGVPSEPPVQANVAAAQQDANTTTVLTAGNDGAVWDRWVVQSGIFQGPSAKTPTGTVAPGAQIALQQNGASELDAFFVDTQGRVREMTETNNAWTLVSTPLTAAGSLASGARLATGLVNGNIRLVAYVDRTGALGGVFSVNGGAWQQGTLTGSNFAANGSPVAMGNQDSTQLDVFVIGTNGALEAMWYNGGWFGPIALSATNVAPVANIATAMQGTSQLDVFFVGSNGAVQGAWVTKTLGIWGAWNAPVNLTQTQYAPPGAGIAPAIMPSGNELDVFFVDNSGALSDVWVAIPGAQPWAGPLPLSPKDYSSPGDGLATAPQFGNQLDVFVAGKAGVIATATNGNGFSPMAPLP
jgi:hypothetical protein